MIIFLNIIFVDSSDPDLDLDLTSDREEYHQVKRKLTRKVVVINEQKLTISLSDFLSTFVLDDAPYSYSK